jgi:transposase
MQITTIGLDIAKNIFQVHGIDAAEKVVVRKQLRRSQILAFFKAQPPCLVGMEACARAHYWARELTKLRPPSSVDAGERREGLRQAQQEQCRRRGGDLRGGARPTIRFVQVESAEPAGRLMLHRTRDLLMRHRTQVINALRAHLAELSIVAAQGNAGSRNCWRSLRARRMGEGRIRLRLCVHELQG